MPGIGAAVIAVNARGAWKLVRTTISRDRLLAALFGVSAAVTAWTESEIVWLSLHCGVVALVVKAPPRLGRGPAALGLAPWPAWLVTGLYGIASAGTLGKLGRYFAEAGAFVFGRGLAIVPFLHGGVVDRFGWLSDRQFHDAVAVAMITPGPVVIWVRPWRPWASYCLDGGEDDQGERRAGETGLVP